MKITDRTIEKSNRLTFKRGDVVKAYYKSSNLELFYLISATPQGNTSMVNLSGEGHFSLTQDGDVFTPEKCDDWTFELVNAELIVTSI